MAKKKVIKNKVKPGTKAPVAKPLGRPSDYTIELGQKLCSELAEGKSLRTVCLIPGMPDKSTVFDWFRRHPDFADQYARAKEESAEAMNEELADLGDLAIQLSKTVNAKKAGAVVQAVKLKADNMKWAMSKMKPKKYGERLDMTTNGKDIPTPIYGGLSVQKHDGNEKDLPVAEEN